MKIKKILLKLLIVIIFLVFTLTGILLTLCGGFFTILSFDHYRLDMIYGLGYLIVGIFLLYIGDKTEEKIKEKINNNQK